MATVMCKIIYNQDLISDLARQKVVLFLGAGVSSSVSIDENNRFKTWPDFLQAAAESKEEPLHSQIKELLDKKDYLLACELLQSDYGESWGEVVTSEYGRAAKPSTLHHALISLKQRVVLTTNFDKLIETAWGISIPDGERHYKLVTTVDSNIFRILRDHETPYIIKIHGTIDDTDNIVFSRSQYIRLAFGNENYASFLDSLLLNYTFLFVGFSMDDPAITSLMELYTLRYPGARPHYIIASNTLPDNIRNVHRRLRKLIVIPYDPRENHSELPLLIKGMAEETERKRSEIIAHTMSQKN